MRASQTCFAYLSLAVIAVPAMLFSGCASSPKLYPNRHYNDVGKDKAEADIDDCEKKADEFGASSRGKKVATGAGTGAVVGAAAGGVLGLFTGHVASGALVGGAVGGAGGAAHGAMSPDQIKHKFVDRCLKDKGYEVLGWD